MIRSKQKKHSERGMKTCLFCRMTGTRMRAGHKKTRLKRPPGGGGFPYENEGVIVGNVFKNTYKVPEFCFVGVVRTILTPKRYQIS